MGILLITVLLGSLTSINIIQNESIYHKANLIIRWQVTTFAIIPGVLFSNSL